MFSDKKDIDVIDDSDPEQLQERWTRYVKKHISYDVLMERYKYDKERIDEFVRIMVMVICFGTGTYSISGCKIPAKVVRSQFEKLEMDHIIYVIESFKQTKVPMTAPDNYIIASLYSAYNTSYNETMQQCNYDSLRNWL